jgi:hypothetical protein
MRGDHALSFDQPSHPGYMREHLDESFVARFRDASDTPPTMIAGENISKEQQNLWAGIRITVRLQQFIREFSEG